MVTGWFVSNPLATSLALLALNGVVPIGWPETVEIVVWALVRINEVPALMSSESLACFFASIINNPVPRIAFS